MSKESAKHAKKLKISRVSLNFACFALSIGSSQPGYPQKPERSGNLRMSINDPKVIDKILDECRTIAVVGLSSNRSRPSFGVARYLKQEGYRIIPVNPNETEVLGERAYSSLMEVPEKIDLVDIFRRSDEAGAHVDEAIRLGAKAVWMQEGVIDHAAAERALQAGLMVVMDRCLLKEHMGR
jgi:predicted CoA-binding protein